MSAQVGVWRDSHATSAFPPSLWTKKLHRHFPTFSWPQVALRKVPLYARLLLFPADSRIHSKRVLRGIHKTRGVLVSERQCFVFRHRLILLSRDSTDITTLSSGSIDFQESPTPGILPPLFELPVTNPWQEGHGVPTEDVSTPTESSPRQEPRSRGKHRHAVRVILHGSLYY